jgi:hypothetical protein
VAFTAPEEFYTEATERAEKKEEIAFKVAPALNQLLDRNAAWKSEIQDRSIIASSFGV